MTTEKTFDVVVVGAGVFGAWTGYQLSRAGAEVLLVDAYGPGNSRASSGGESRIVRMGYGPDQIYTRMALHSLGLWQELFDHIGQTGISPRLFQPTGVLWLARENDPYCEATLETFQQNNVEFARLERVELVRRYPQLELGSVTWGILEPNSGVLMARQGVQAVVAQALAEGVTYLQEAILPPGFERAKRGTGKGIGAVARPSRRVSNANANNDHNATLKGIETISGRRIFANKFVFACGPWLPKIFPALLAQLIHVTRQEVFFFGVPAGDAFGVPSPGIPAGAGPLGWRRAARRRRSSGQGTAGSRAAVRDDSRFGPERMPAWIDFTDLVYGIPNLDNRGFKIAIDAHGPPFDPDTSDRLVSKRSLAAVRAYLARRMPELANAPVIETRVCQYENTSNGDFLIDRHPAFENVWLVGGGSGHGFKHGPAVGEHVAALISGDAKVEPRFALATKERVQQRKVY